MVQLKVFVVCKQYKKFCMLFYTIISVTLCRWMPHVVTIKTSPEEWPVVALARAVPMVAVAVGSPEGARIPLHFPADAEMQCARALPRPLRSFTAALTAVSGLRFLSITG